MRDRVQRIVGLDGVSCWHGVNVTANVNVNPAILDTDIV